MPNMQITSVSFELPHRAECREPKSLCETTAVNQVEYLIMVGGAVLD